MYSSKSGRVGGGGGGSGRRAGAAKLGRASFPPPLRSSTQTSRLSLGGSNPRGRNSGSNTSAAAAPPAVEEQFSLVAGRNPLAFSVIIRMAPDLVEEIKRVEDQGGAPRIKFGPSPNNSLGNVIDLGGKEFTFTWDQEVGDLCDIYEEHESGEGGNGLLVESGFAWRKVNVHRILDESTKNRFKQWSEEAERKNKSRKAIVLEQCTETKNQLKQYDTTTANQPWRNFKRKKEPPFKKQKVEPPQAPPKSTFKTGVSSTTTAKGKYSSSPLQTPPEQSGALSSPLRTRNNLKSHASAEDIIPFQVIKKDKPAPSSDKEIQIRTSIAPRETVGKGNSGANATDLLSMLIALLTENPKGMRIKDLEKAIADSYPNSIKKIEPIIKKIANYQAPGRYVLKSGAELESLKKPVSESGSSPEDKLCQKPAPDGNRELPVQAPHFEEKVSPNELEEQVHERLDATVGQDSSALIKIDYQQHSPDFFGEKRGPDDNEARGGSSSDTGSASDSDSDSSDTGSDSGSHSRSKSSARNGSGSSSDSESDASSNSKEGFDEDVDIMASDDEKELKHKLQGSERGFSTLPVPWRNPDGKHVQSGIDEKQDDLEVDAVEIEKQLLDADQVAELAVVSNSNRNKSEPLEETKPFSPEHGELQGRQSLVDPVYGGESLAKDDFKDEQSDSSEKISKGTSKRGSEVKHTDEKSEHNKRLKTEISRQSSISAGKGVHLSEASHNLSPDRLVEGSHKDPVSQMMDRDDRDGNIESGSLKACNQAFSGRYTSEFKQSSQQFFYHNLQTKVPDSAERPDRYAESLGHGGKYSEKSSQMHDGFLLQKDKFHRDTQNEDGYANERKVPRNSKEGGTRGKQSVPLDPHYQKDGDMAGKIKGSAQVSSLLLGSSPKDNSRNGAAASPVINGKGSILQREFSDLELGELREPLPEETTVNKQFERKGSFKQSDDKKSISENQVSEFSKVKRAGKANFDSGRPSSPDLNSKFPSNQEGLNKKRNYEDRIEDLTRSQQRAVQSESQHPPRVDHPDLGRSFSKTVGLSSKSRQNEAGGRQAIGVAGHGESNKKAIPSAPQQHDSKRGLVSHPIQESKRHASNIIVDSTDVRKKSMVADCNDTDRKKRDSSSDENSCSYSKYEKNEPELKGPINNLSQYEEYVQEYRDKYDSYCSLNKTLESYRNEFEKLGKDLDYATQGTEKYYNILGQVKESYRGCEKKHKRLKRIFVVLHEELKRIKQRIKDFAISYMED
ncbi:dentin sialophosphoprotein-like [Pyrus ussuriensis x Pyrus communis]|uniref:Dentin sialophosphoprotein-like n=1 Tax=Pyrus ussuriensis x Pyrus communis TaxID=2448454 RepID=A0A5N5G7R2_9ROSA|nr:dentin sialophosphoprotein-like [Pyrus ussuriensis x Pyrus communis]